MCNARSNLISGKHFDLDRFAFASNLRKSHENTFNLLHTGGSKRKREGRTNLEIGSGLFLKFQSKEEYSKTNLIDSMAPVLTPRTPFFLLYRIVTTGDNLQVGTTRRVQEEQDENVW
jgi:hypothetical protein